MSRRTRDRTGLSKSRLLSWRQCPKRLWLELHRPELAAGTDTTDHLMTMGTAVGEVARTLHPGGILIEGEDLATALRDTRRLLLESPCPPLFEATFEHEGVLVRADLLLPDEGGHRLVEVKASTSVKPVHLDDLAIQTWVLQGAGTTLTGCCLSHIDNSFVYPGNGDYRGLFREEALTSEIAKMLGRVPGWIAGARATLAGAEPGIAPGKHCTDPWECPFREYCSPPPRGETYPPEILPWARDLPARLRDQGYEDLREVPPGLLPNPLHQRIRQVTIEQVPFLDAEAGRVLSSLGWPRYYLDFETIQFAVPIWQGTRPYQQIPFQWSCHIEREEGSIEHREFLAADESDPRPAFIESLLGAIGPTGCVFVYNAGFEGRILGELATDFPAHAAALTLLGQRLFDLLPLTRHHYYHPGMRGSWSLKAVLPTIAPELDYCALEIADGGMAQAAFLELLDTATDARRKMKLHAGLLEYCGRDTLALVRLAHHLQGG